MHLAFSLHVICLIGALVLSAYDVLSSRGRSILGWAVLLLSLVMCGV